MELEQLTSFLSIAHAKCYKVVGEISGAIFLVFLGVLDSLFGVFSVHCESSARCRSNSKRPQVKTSPGQNVPELVKTSPKIGQNVPMVKNVGQNVPKNILFYILCNLRHILGCLNETVLRAVYTSCLDMQASDQYVLDLYAFYVYMACCCCCFVELRG